jgi:hypothetical protein
MPYDEVDRLLVEGELLEAADGTETRTWPTQRELAQRYQVAPSLVAAFAKSQRCAERKEAFRAGTPISFAELEGRDGRTVRPRPLMPASSPGAPSGAESEVGPKRRRGRPRKAEVPLIPYEELHRLLVFGEVIELDSGATTTVFPTYRELAARYGVAVSVIAGYAKTRNCLRRREEAKTRIEVRTEAKLIEKRAEALAVGRDDVVRMIDEYLLNFQKALEEGRVRTDNPTDVNTLVRLKEFVMGGADTRQELRATLSLDGIQQRYARMMRSREEATPEQTGVIDVRSSTSGDESEQGISNAKLSNARKGERSLFSEAVSEPSPLDENVEKASQFEDLEDRED